MSRWTTRTASMILAAIAAAMLAPAGARAIETFSDSVEIRTQEPTLFFNDTDTGATIWNLCVDDGPILCGASSEGFAIEYVDQSPAASATPFTIESGAPDHAVYIAAGSGGSVGIGTSTPFSSAALHVAKNGLLALSYGPDGSIWALQPSPHSPGGLAFIDVSATPEPTIPVFVSGGAPSGSLVIGHDTGNLGLGTEEPAESVHVKKDDAKVFVESTGGAKEVLFKLERAGKVRFEMKNASSNVSWTFDHSGENFTINREANATGNEFRLTSAGDLFLTGSLFQGSAADSKEDFRDVDRTAMLDKVLRRPIQEWRYKEQLAEDATRHVGPTAEDFQAAFGLSEETRHIGVGDMSGVALAALQGFNEVFERELGRRDDQIAALGAQNEALEQRLRRLEARD